LIPYFEQPHLGPIHLFGVLVVCAIFFGSKVLTKRAAQYKISAETVQQFVTWIMVAGFIGAHLVDRFVYFPSETLEDPWSIVKVWQGISSFGGFLGGAVGGLLFFRYKLKEGTAWQVADSFAYAFPFGWVFGRLGCFSAFDHPGRPTTFFLGQMDAKGIVRHNLGLEEALYTVLIVIVFSILGRKPRFTGFFLGMFLVLYTPFRFIVDYLRIVDVRYFGLTPGQYGCIALFIVGLVILRVRSKAAA
jgi:phosphatidylglycerol:prolipoprotein diacylglycerol transferase